MILRAIRILKYKRDVPKDYFQVRMVVGNLFVLALMGHQDIIKAVDEGINVVAEDENVLNLLLFPIKQKDIKEKYRKKIRIS